MKNSEFKTRISFLTIGIWLGILLLSVPAFGEFYKYVGPDGRIRFTDDYSKVPMEQRHSSKEYKDSAGEPSDQDPPVSEPKAEEFLPAPTKKQEGGSVTSTEKELVETKNRLEGQRQELFLEHEALMKEKEGLQSMTKTTREEIQAFNEKAAEFNAKIKDYEKRLEIHNQETAAYNEQVKSQNESIEKKKEKEKEKEKKK
jgi:hypothetical protein